MRILALETTERLGGVAAALDGNILADLSLGEKLRSAQSLAPALRDILGQVGWRPDDVQLVAVSSGPGSFTGLRVGVTTAKAFAYAVRAEVLGIDTLETIAAAAPEDVRDISIVMDAQRGEVVARRFVRQPDGWFAPAGPQVLMEAEQWLRQLLPAAVVSGPVLAKLRERLPSGVVALDERFWAPRAVLVAKLAARDYALGRRDDVWKLSPHYFRRSAAEEKWDARGLP